jgi:hypothetical protein
VKGAGPVRKEKKKEKREEMERWLKVLVFT